MSKTPVGSGMKPLTERQQMALLLQMTSEENSTPSRRLRNDNESPGSAPRSVNRRNERGETQLHVAAIKGDAQKLRALIQQGADVNTADYAGSLTIKFHFKKYELIHLFCTGWTPLHEAANRGFLSVARELLKNGAKVNAAGMDGVTPLHDASVNGHESMVALLLRFGANPSLKTASNKTAQDLAGCPQIIQLLSQQDHGEDVGTDENSPEGPIVPYHEGSWKVKKQNPKSRRSLRLGKIQNILPVPMHLLDMNSIFCCYFQQKATVEHFLAVQY